MMKKKKIIFDGWDWGIYKDLISCATSENDLYVSVWDVGILKFSNYFKTANKKDVHVDTILKQNQITKIFFDNNKNLWATSQKSGVYFLKHPLKSLKELTFTQLPNSFYESKHILSFENKIYLGLGENLNLLCLNTENKSYNFIKSNLNLFDHTNTYLFHGKTIAINHKGIYSVTQNNNQLFFECKTDDIKNSSLRDYEVNKNKMLHQSFLPSLCWIPILI
jgi:hypothetical protein